MECPVHGKCTCTTQLQMPPINIVVNPQYITPNNWPNNWAYNMPYNWPCCPNSNVPQPINTPSPCPPWLVNPTEGSEGTEGQQGRAPHHNQEQNQCQERASSVTDGLINTLADMEHNFGISALNSIFQQQRNAHAHARQPQPQQQQQQNLRNDPITRTITRTPPPPPRRRRMSFHPPTRGIGPMSAFANEDSMFPFFVGGSGGNAIAGEYEFSAIIPIIIDGDGNMTFDSNWESDQGRPPSLTDEEINLIPSFAHQILSESDRQTCIICQNSIDQGIQVKRLHCNHIFHSECISAWLKQSDTCPLCREVVQISTFQAGPMGTSARSSNTLSGPVLSGPVLSGPVLLDRVMGQVIGENGNIYDEDYENIPEPPSP